MSDKTKQFLQKLRDSGHWNDDYDYSKVEYVNNHTNVIIVDDLGFNHTMTARSVLIGNKLSILSAIDKSKFFTYKAKLIHGDKYNYSNLIYLDAKTKIEIIDEFGFKHHQLPFQHLKRTISIESADNKNEYIIKQFKDIHGDKYDYSKVNYTGSTTKVKIICSEHGTFEQSPSNHTNIKRSSGCPKCVGKLKTTIDIIKDFVNIHNDKYDYSKVDYINGKTKVTIICPEHGDFKQRPSDHITGKGCKKCSGVYRPSNEEYITMCKNIHGDKYDYSLTYYVNNRIKVKIMCPEHGVFEQTPSNHTHSKHPQGCPNCNGTLKPSTNSFVYKIKSIYGDIYDYSKVVYVNSKTKVIVINKKYNSEHLMTPTDMLSQHSRCNIKNAVDKNEYIIKEFNDIHKDKYNYSKVMYSGDKNDIKIICSKHGEFNQTPGEHKQGAGCPICGIGFIKSYKLKLINDLQHSDLLEMDPFELMTIIDQGKLSIDFKELVNTEAESEERIATLRELQERYEIEGDDTDDIEQEVTTGDAEPELVEVDDVDSDITTTEEQEPRLPSVNTIRDLHSLDNSIYAGMDEEAFESLVQFKIRKLWNLTLNGDTDISKIRKETGGKYFTTIKDEFLSEYENVLLVKPSEGYSFPHQPNLMQKLTVYRLLKNKYYGNWSGTGAGKTLSFILASRAMNSKLTLVIALNSTIKQTCESIKEVYPDSKCYTDYRDNYVFDRNNHNFLVLNYEKFQQEQSEKNFQSLTNNNQIDFVVIDEVHNAKQRKEEDESIRRGVMVRLLGRARENDSINVLAMSATPVINNLYEAKSLLSLMSGLEYNDLQTRRTIGNALKIFQQLLLNGLRFIPKYAIKMTELTGRNMSNLDIDGSHLLDDLLELSQNDYIGVEKLILSDKLKAVTPYIQKGTIIYSYFTTGIINNIQKHVESLEFKVGTYTGGESTVLREKNLKDFISGKIDVLIGSRPIGTGVDGLQSASNRMICITLPWTDSEYTQLKGRIYRQGSEFDGVEIIIPQVKIPLDDGEVWSWDIQRINLIKNKKTLADAAVDGIIPSNVLPTRETMFRKSIESLKNWQDRVDSGNIVSTNRNTVQMNLYPEIDDEQERQRRITSELSEFNRRGKTTRSSTMHKEFSDNPDSWRRYHALRKERMDSWEEIPYEYIATKIKDTRDVVADFGCGENLFKDCIPNNKVYSFDHIAIDDSVTACDMKNTGLNDESVDITVFSLALWGTNSSDYIKEAYRILRRKGMIYISEPSKNYDTPEKQEVLVGLLNEIGFQQVGEIENRGKFIYITGIKI
jgi:hypothetical protein